MITLASVELCSGCTACKAVCPKQAISMVADHEGFLRPQIDAEKCVQCHACERACPVLHPSEPDSTPTCYAARTKDEALRMDSSSGGLFTELARPILAKGGVVFGCVWEKPALVAIHAKAETEDELAAMRGSKYVQSDLRDTYREAKAELQKGREVLFSGTPCQIAGLNHYLGKTYPNLLTVEIVCHGVPSPAVFEKFKQEMLHSVGEHPCEIFFKDKRKGWKSPSLVVKFPTHEEIVQPCYASPFGSVLLKGLALRPSCHACASKNGKSGADVSIADFWGIDKAIPLLDDNTGISAIFLHTERAKQFCSTLPIEMHAVTVLNATQYNPSYYSSSPCAPSRALFMKKFKSKSLKHVVLRCTEGIWFKRVVMRTLRFGMRVFRFGKRCIWATIKK